MNGVLVSSYAVINDHHTAHLFMGLIRWYYYLEQWIFPQETIGYDQNDGIHPMIEFIYRASKLCFPAKLATV